MIAIETYYSHFSSPLGSIYIEGAERYVTALFMQRHKKWRAPDPSTPRFNALFAAVREQLTEYFAGERNEFDIPLELIGTPFQRRVWQELQRIPCGQTITYADLARRLGKPTASRAVGHAVGRNPVSIIVPCHRVIGSNGNLTGYAGGLDAKRRLLARERRLAS
jgi:methylated-DNA-[protein]-cysteine S-methyltransferase